AAARRSPPPAHTTPSTEAPWYGPRSPAIAPARPPVLPTAGPPVVPPARSRPAADPAPCRFRAPSIAGGRWGTSTPAPRARRHNACRHAGSAPHGSRAGNRDRCVAPRRGYGSSTVPAPALSVVG